MRAAVLLLCCSSCHGAITSITAITAITAMTAISSCHAVITSQGPWGPRLEEEEAVREFTGWLEGGEGDYVMTLAQANRRKQAASSNANRLDLFRPGVQGGFGGLGPAGGQSLQNLTYYQSEDNILIISYQFPLHSPTLY